MVIPPIVAEFADELSSLGWVSELFVGGSLATGDYRLGVSDLDLVALVIGSLDPSRRAALSALHRRLDSAGAAGMNLGCAYVEDSQLNLESARHPTWTHGTLVMRTLSGVARVELVRFGFAVFGRAPQSVLAAVDDEDVRQAARAEISGYWAWALRRPWIWLDPVLADLGLTSMARARHTFATGRLITKTAAIDNVHAPAWLIEQLPQRRDGIELTSPRLRTAAIAWADARRTVRAARRWDAQ